MNRPVRAIALAIPILSMLLVITSAVLFTRDGVFGGDSVSNALILVGIACYVVIGGLIASRRPENACGWLLLLVGGGLAAAVFSDALATDALREGFVTLASWADWANAALFFVTLAGIPLYLLVFPTGRPPSPRWRPVALVVIGIAVVGTLVNVLAPSGDVDVENPIVVASIAPALEALRAALTFAFIAAAVLCVASVVVRWRRAATPERLQLRWLAVVAVLAAALLIGSIAFGVLGLHRIGDPLGVAFILVLTTGIPVSAGIALLRHHAHGIEVVANRSIVYGALAALITSTYAVVVAGAGAVVGRSERSNVLLAVAATVAAAIIVHPARQRAQRFADLIIYGYRASPFELVSTFSERLGSEPYDDALPQMARLVADGIGADEVRVWLRTGAELRAASCWPPAAASPPPSKRLVDDKPSELDDPAFPVRYRGMLLGAIDREDAAPRADDACDRAPPRGSRIAGRARRPQRLARRGAAGVSRTIGHIARRGATATRARSARRSATAVGHPLYGPAPGPLESGV